MRLELTGRHVEITPGLRRLVTTKLSKLERMLNHRAVSAQAVLSREKHSVRADITLHARGEGAEAMPPPPSRPAARAARERVRMPRILRATRRAIKPMSVADATREID